MSSSSSSSSSSTNSENSDNEERDRKKSPSPTKSGSGHGSDASSAPSHRSPVRRTAESDSDDNEKMPLATRSSEEGSGNESTPRKKKMQLADSDDSDNEDGDKGKSPKNTADLFGDDVSSDSNSDDDKEHGDKQDKSDDDASKRASSPEGSLQGIVMRAGSDDEPDEEDKAPAMIEAVCSHFNIDMGEEPTSFIKLPNFLSLESKPFDPDYFTDSDEERPDEEGNKRLKLKVENTIRWRKVLNDGGNEVRESNAKVVKWSDGTMSLYLGSEIFDIQEQPMVEHNHLYLRQGAGLIGQQIFQKKWNFRPHSTDSKTHRKVTMSMAERTRKGAQVKMIAQSQIGVNPEKQRAENARKEEEKLRAALRAQFATTARNRRDRDGANRYYRGGDEDDDLGAIKRRFKDAPLIGASGSESEEEGSAKAETSDSDEEFRRKKQQKKKFVVDDDSD